MNKEFKKHEFIKMYNDNLSLEITRKFFGYSRKFVDKMCLMGEFEKIPLIGRKTLEDRKIKISVSIKNYIKNHNNGNRFVNSPVLA